MPETYIEPMTNRQECFQCHKTVTGKKKLSKCSGCHAITYCGVECQREDFPRHKWNCLPVMVTEIPGKGRGLVAARDIKMGEQIFTDKAHIKLYSFSQDRNEDIKSIQEQLNKLPSEARRQFHMLPVRDVGQTGDGDILSYTRFMHNARVCLARDESELHFHYLSLNMALINHSCAPNVAAGPLEPYEEIKNEVRAIRDISRGDEVTVSYTTNRYLYSINLQRRREKLKALFLFDCNCPVCSGMTADQWAIMRKIWDLVEFEQKLVGVQKKSMDWQREARLIEEIIELTDEVYIGDVVNTKKDALTESAILAHLGRDEALLGKALDSLYKLREDTKLEHVSLFYETFKENLSMWSAQFKSKKPASKDEIESIYKNRK